MTAPPDAHAAEHDDLLHDHLAGDVPADDPRLVERLASCAACRARLEELRALTDLLERVGDQQRRNLAPPAAPAPGRERVAATLEALADGRPPHPLRPVAPPTRRTTLWRVGLAAASVLAAGWVVKSLLPPDAEPREDVMLGDRVDTTLTPVGTVESFESFDCSEPPPEAVRFDLIVWRDGASADEAPILTKPSVKLPWTPSPEDLEILNEARAIEWELAPFDAFGAPLAPKRARVRLEP